MLLCVASLLAAAAAFYHCQQPSRRVLFGMSLREEEEEDNIHKQWSIDDDRVLIARADQGESIESLCVLLKRGRNGVKARIASLRNRDSKPFQRLYGGAARDKSMQLEEEEEEEGKVRCAKGGTLLLRPISDVITKLLWDQTLELKDFSFVYTDRFDGLCERSCSSANENVKGKERLLIKAIPPHRIEQVKYKQRVVWCKKTRLDLVFGSGSENASAANDVVFTNEEEGQAVFRLENVIANYDAWLTAKEEKESQSKSTIHLFCDLDGVLADFDAGVVRLFGRNPDNVSPKVLWPRLATTSSFYSTLPWTCDGKALWSELVNSGHKVSIITGSPRGGWAEAQKREWCARELSLADAQQVIVCPSKDKHLFCESPLSVLIDDRKQNCELWEAKGGGKYILHRDASSTIAALQELLSSLTTELL